MPIDLISKPIVITGASSGIGAATALACARAGMPVVMAARRLDRLARLAEQISREGGRAVSMEMDVRDAAACAALIELCIREFGSIHAVYANAGYGTEKPVHRMTDEQMREIFEVNFFGTLNTIRPALPRLNANAPGPGGVRGHVLICSSCLARMSVPYYSAYSATKAAQCHIGRAMNLELRPRGIKVTTICPVRTRTEFSDRVRHESSTARLVPHTPDHLMHTADFVAAETIDVLRRPRTEVWPGAQGVAVRLGMAMACAIPRIADFFMRRMVSRWTETNGTDDGP